MFPYVYHMHNTGREKSDLIYRIKGKVIYKKK